MRQADAEQLPFADQSFDLVYSWGVLHHTPDTGRAVEEVRRVLKVGGEARVMLYSRRSWVVLGLWLRYGLARGRPFRSATDLLSEHMESTGTKAYTTAELHDAVRRLLDGRAAALRHPVRPPRRRAAGPAGRAALRLVRRDPRRQVAARRRSSGSMRAAAASQDSPATRARRRATAPRRCRKSAQLANDRGRELRRRAGQRDDVGVRLDLGQRGGDHRPAGGEVLAQLDRVHALAQPASRRTG